MNIIKQIGFKCRSSSPKIVNHYVRLAKSGARSEWRSSKAFNEFIETVGIRAEGAGAAIIVPRGLITEIYRTDLGKARDVLNLANL